MFLVPHGCVDMLMQAMVRSAGKKAFRDPAVCRANMRSSRMAPKFPPELTAVRKREDGIVLGPARKLSYRGT